MIRMLDMQAVGQTIISGPMVGPVTYRNAFVSPDGKDDESYKQLMADPEQWMGDQLLNIIGNANPEEE